MRLKFLGLGISGVPVKILMVADVLAALQSPG
jgi:hypothetical protein